MTALWTWDALVAAADATADGTPSADIVGFSIDTRSIQLGDVFVALTDSRDGHDFVPAAFKAGAAAAMVSTTYHRKSGDGPLLRVDDPLAALGRIAIAARARLSPAARVIAVTGSAGKTGTKEMLRACLAPLGKTHAPEKSFNNHWGVPLTLARMPSDTMYAIIEIGMNHAGEITPLTRMTRPHIAIITNVLPVHIGNFPDGEIGVANAKAEIFAGLEPGGVAVILCDSPHSNHLYRTALTAGAQVRTFGTGPTSHVRAVAMTCLDALSEVDVHFGQTNVSYEVGTPGRHLAINSLAVVAVLDFLELRLPSALAPLALLSTPAGRGARSTITLPLGTFLLIDESYNANPASMRAALAALALVPRAAHLRRLVVLGDMRELGRDAPALHLGLKDAVDAAAPDLVFACGEHMQGLYDQLDASLRGYWCATSTELAAHVAAAIRPGDVVMIKGSLGTNMAPIVSAVRALGKPAAVAPRA